MKACVIPGSFDPITLGHMDIVRRACALCDSVTVAVLVNAAKASAFTLDERKSMVIAATNGLPGVRVDAFSGALTDYMRGQGIGVIVRGARTEADFAMETRLAAVYRAMDPEVELVLLPASAAVAHISSGVVRELAGLGKDLRGWVPDEIASAVLRKYEK